MSDTTLPRQYGTCSGVMLIIGKDGDAVADSINDTRVDAVRGGDVIIINSVMIIRSLIKHPGFVNI